MPEHSINRFRNESLRLKNWDYSRGGKYYVTLKTKYNQKLFGNVTNGKMQLSEYGSIADRFWKEIPDHFQDTWLDGYMIMPDHIHGIIVMRRHSGSPKLGDPSCLGENEISKLGDPSCRMNQTIISGEDGFQNQPSGGSIIPNWSAGSLGVIINQFKRICTLTYKKSGMKWPGWQPRYYEEIIRSDQRLQQIRWYILTNPANWENKKQKSN